MSGWLPPGCTDKHVDDAANGPDDYWYFQGDTEPGTEAQQLGEWMDRTEARIREECGRGHRVSMMLMIERIVKENKLDRFPKLDSEK